MQSERGGEKRERVDILRLFGDLGEVKRKKESIHLAKDDTS